jgi:hypothetical protein
LIQRGKISIFKIFFLKVMQRSENRYTTGVSAPQPRLETKTSYREGVMGAIEPQRYSTINFIENHLVKTF